MHIGDYRFANYRVAVGLLEGQGWERERPTLPRLHLSSCNAVGIGPFPFIKSILMCWSV